MDTLGRITESILHDIHVKEIPVKTFCWGSRTNPNGNRLVTCPSKQAAWHFYIIPPLARLVHNITYYLTMILQQCITWKQVLYPWIGKILSGTCQKKPHPIMLIWKTLGFMVYPERQPQIRFQIHSPLFLISTNYTNNKPNGPLTGIRFRRQFTRDKAHNHLIIQIKGFKLQQTQL